MMKRFNECGGERKNNFLSEMMGIKTNNSPMRSLNDEGVMKLLTSNITQGYIIVSADDNIGNNSQTVNGNRIREIRNDIKDSKFLYIPLFGKYEDANDESAEIYKSSFAIMNRKEKGERPSFKELIELGESLTKKYGQEGFIIHEANKRPTYVNSAGQCLYNFDVSENISENINETIKYFFEKKIAQDQDSFHDIALDNNQSKVRKSRISFKEAFLNPSPATYNSRVMRGMGREIF